MSARERLYPDDLTMEQARNLYFAANGFDTSDYEAATFTVKAFGLSLKFPNIGERKRVVPLHDLHHVLTDYTTDWVGEAEIGAWELRAGCRSWITYLLNAGGVIIGFFIAPLRTCRAFQRAKGHRTL
jgi:hypothetical protein